MWILNTSSDLTPDLSVKVITEVKLKFAFLSRTYSDYTLNVSKVTDCKSSTSKINLQCIVMCDFKVTIHDYQR